MVDEMGTTPLTTMSTNSTNSPNADDKYPEYVGFICCIVAVVLYGSNFVPVKKFNTGDGMFFQYVLVSGIFLVGIVIQIVQGSEFYSLVMLGGFIWATGNLCVVPIFKTIGMGLGMSLWGTCALLAGWASGKFGWFDTKADEIGNPTMNYIGVGLAFGSIMLYLLVKNEVSANTDVEIVVPADEVSPLISGSQSSVNDSRRMSPPYNYTGDDVLVFNKSVNHSRKYSNSQNKDDEAEDRMWIETLSPKMKRIIGIGLSLFSGIMYGLNFAPFAYVKQNTKGASQNGLDYVFAHFCGIYISGSLYFYIYCAIRKSKPKVYPRVILPGIISGILWAGATACWFIANATLDQSVTFPIVSTGPAAIASLFWGVCVFKEIKGSRNIFILVLAFLVMSAGAILAGLSKSSS